METKLQAQKSREKWNFASFFFDCLTWADDKRFSPFKSRLFKKIKGKTLLVGAGTGKDFKFLPHDGQVVAIDISPKMLERAALKAKSFPAILELKEADVCALDFPDAFFDSVLSVCTFCSVADPLRGMREVYRVLRPGGNFYLFEHVRSRIGPIGVLFDLLTPLSQLLGPDLNRDTVSNVRNSGFRIVKEENIYLDIVKWIEAVRI
ncbi:class I SAM-dependent methyltransferase [Methylacidiphilum caldifontis]|uniref:SAM-dependent methyltransferase n=1 Tax=Methylacidiphilum caldifontis TaxID=2795386 RepID=A0A4Y8PHY0_9BACT|nr:class I SAM-dependent methyltransferase [Methylacidiphilum caldifontis]TFE73417.1 SAM-dependent methyltransferase [Methylacidiphilum caldifontis]